MNNRVFNKSVIGSSHINTGKPCQDYSHSSNTDSYSIIVVSDGHGSETYVRSEVGSKIAGQIAEEKTVSLLEIIRANDRLKNINISVGPKPYNERAKSLIHKRLSQSHEQLDQEIKYFETIEGKEDIDDFFRLFFNDIFTEWKRRITEDAANNPFTKEEELKLGNNDIVKAYGCTLLVAVLTEEFDFAFQIGDGKCFFSNAKNEWFQPIPWDCKCFLNITTSLCMDGNPVNEFRYSFNSKVEKPVVIILGSDGVDGCYEDDKVKELELDYYAIIDAFYKSSSLDSFSQDLTDFLTQKSAHFSRDDMSISAIVCVDKLETWLELNDIKKQVYIESQEGEKIKKEICRLEAIKEKQQSRLKELRNQKLEKDKAKKKFKQLIDLLTQQIKEQSEKLSKHQKSYKKNNEVLTEITSELGTLETKAEEIENKILEANKKYLHWKHNAETKVQDLRDKRDSLLESSISTKDGPDTSIEEGLHPISINEVSKQSDQVLFAKIGTDAGCYTFRVARDTINYEKENEARSATFDEIKWGEFIKSLCNNIDFSKYTNNFDNMGQEYAYLTFLQGCDQIENYFIPPSDETIIKGIFLDLWKFD